MVKRRLCFDNFKFGD